MLCVAIFRLYSFEARDYRASSRESMHPNTKEIRRAKTRDQQMTNVLMDSMENVQANSDHRIYDTIPSSLLQTTKAGLTDTS